MHGCARHICVVTIAYRQSPERKKFWMHEIRLNIKKRNLAFLSAMIMIITDRGILVEKSGYRLAWFDAENNVLYQLISDALSQEEIVNIANNLL